MSIAKLVATGKTSQTIADELNLSPRTVENHRAEILRKLNLRNAADLAVYVKEQGW
jgi:DNA-binding NarL/FixJ family response regulator